MLAGVGDVRQKLVGIRNLERHNISSSQGHSIHVHREIGRRDHGGITWSHERQAHMAEAFFAAQANNRFGLWIQSHAILAEILAGQSRRRFNSPLLLL